MLDLFFCNFKCIVPNNKMQPTMDISSIMMNWIFGHIFMIEFGLFIIVCLSIYNLNKECIVVPFVNKVTFVVYLASLSFCCFPIFKK
jgi:hypothetical protein